MAAIKLADAVRWLNDRYDAELTYQQLYMFGLQRRVPVERDGRFWVIDDADLPRIGKTLGLAKKPASKPAGKPTAKPKPAAKPSRSARSRANRSASAA